MAFRLVEQKNNRNWHFQKLFGVIYKTNLLTCSKVNESRRYLHNIPQSCLAKKSALATENTRFILEL
jgi:hypothetical protein